MPAARLTQIRLRNFKSIGPEEQTVDLKPLTVLIGRNNSGKSTVIQSLLLLKQTLEDPRPEVQLALQGNYVRATSLRELTHGWPEDMEGKGPEITLRWESVQSPRSALGRLIRLQHTEYDSDLVGPRLEKLLNFARTSEFVMEGKSASEISICFRELESAVIAQCVDLRTLWADAGISQAPMVALWKDGVRKLVWEAQTARELAEDHFVPSADPRAVVSRSSRAVDVLFYIFYWKQLESLKSLLMNVGYVSSSRDEVPPYYARPTSTPTRNMLPNGGNAPELLYGRQADIVHRAMIDGIGTPDQAFSLPAAVGTMSLKEAVNDVLRYLGIESSVSFADVQELGLFRMLFGRAPLNHVGRGIGHILPVIVAGLLSDPLLGQKLDPDITLSDYLERCTYSPILALEELESHLHPKAQSRLAHVLVALARSGRQLIVETHSDHLVRRLRGLIARSEPGSETEKWLLANINIVEVEQTPDGVTYLHQAQLTREGSIEKWPADFMDESSDEERAIYFAAMQKSPPAAPPADESFFTDVPANGKG
jgi:energy-coupling factor transporter ATP-binding protein EcfA2